MSPFPTGNEGAGLGSLRPARPRQRPGLAFDVRGVVPAGRTRYSVARGRGEGFLEQTDGRPDRLSVAQVDEGSDPRGELPINGPRVVHGARKCVIFRRRMWTIRRFARAEVLDFSCIGLGLPIQIL